MAEIIRLKKEKGKFTCEVPISKEQWLNFLHDKDTVSPSWLQILLSFYYMPDHKATCKQCMEKYGGNINTYNSAISALGESIIKTLDTFRIVDDNGKDRSWPVIMGEGKSIKGSNGVFQWMLRPELVEALREYIIEDALSKYVDGFSLNWEREEYKWRALKIFQDNWDIDAPDFADMLAKALAQHKNLLDTSHAFPKSALIEIAQSKPELVRKMFRDLYNEDSPLEGRIANFINTAGKEFNFGEGKSHYQSTNAVSVYLWFRYPEKYYIYKWGEYNTVAQKIGFENTPKATGLPLEVIKGYDMYHQLQYITTRNEKLLNIYNSILDKHPDKYYKPDGLATLTFDFGFWISRYYTPPIAIHQPKTWIYAPGEGAKMWEDTIVNSTTNQPITTEPEVTTVSPRYWWLVASPKFWSFTDINDGDTVEYTVKNDKGNKRRIPANFDNARVGDIVIGYEANPVKKIVALAKVASASDGETISFEKTETLETPIPWSDFNDLETLSEMEFIKNQNGTFFKLTPEEYEIILELIRQENPEPEISGPIKQKENFEPYTKEKFLSEVFMTEQKLEELVQLIKLKKNVILQGAPGVGKTFSAKRLAYCMMGKKDTTRVEMVQFHQNYTYEDFIMGYRPTINGGFELRKGVFYNFCKKAIEHPDKDFFFIIDEINRGNLSKIFGELLMLIENGYRGQSVKLAYSGEAFSVPENLHIIGMMNTADRSLAMIDYALRRRFSFHAMIPGFDTAGFKAEINKHSDPRIPKVVDAIVALNERIAQDDSLGQGFCIGHSYFCGQPESMPWIEHVVKYDICPMLDEYWFDSKEKCKVEKKRLLDLL